MTTSELWRGAVLLGAAAALLQSMDAELAAEDRRPYERAIDLARTQLGDEQFRGRGRRACIGHGGGHYLRAG